MKQLKVIKLGFKQKYKDLLFKDLCFDCPIETFELIGYTHKEPIEEFLDHV